MKHPQLMDLLPHLPPEALDCVKQVWERPDTVFNPGLELYGFRWNHRIFMTRHPSGPYLLHDQASRVEGLVFVIGPRDHSVTLLVPEVATEREASLVWTATLKEREACAALVEPKDPEGADAIRSRGMPG